MGHGYYLKAGHRYDTGWEISKSGRIDPLNPLESLCMSIAKRCIFTGTPKAARTTPAVRITPQAVTVTLNDEKAGIEIAFPGKPEEDIRTALKTHGFRWSRFQKIWYTRQTPEKLEFANSLKA